MHNNGTDNDMGRGWARAAAGSSFRTESDAQNTVDVVLDAVCYAFDLTRSQLTAKTRQPDRVLPRYIATQLLSTDFNFSDRSIADALGLDRSTVTSSKTRLASKLQEIPALRDALDGIRNDVKERLSPNFDPRQPNLFRIAKPATPASDTPVLPRYFGENVCAAVCDAFQITPQALRGGHDCAVPRWIASHIMREQAGYSANRIARLLGVDHSTVRYGLDRLARRLEADATMREAVDVIALSATQMPAPKPGVAAPTGINGSNVLRALRDRAKPPPRSTQLSGDDIAQHVAAIFCVPLERLRAPGRQSDVTVPRWVAMHLMREHLGLPLTAIGEKLGRADHTTVLYGLAQLKQIQQRNPALRDVVQRLETKLGLNANAPGVRVGPSPTVA